MDPPPLSELLGGLHDRQRVQDVIRSALKALHETLRAQSHSVRDVERKVDLLQADRGAAERRCIELVEHHVRSKVDVSELTRNVEEIHEVLRGKATVKELNSSADQVIAILEDKIQKSVQGKDQSQNLLRMEVQSSQQTLDDLHVAIEALRTDMLAYTGDVEARIRRCEDEHPEVVLAECRSLMRKEVDRLSGLLETRASAEDVRALLRESQEREEKQMIKIKHLVESKVSASDFAALTALAEGKVSSAEFESKVTKTCNRRFSALLSQHQLQGKDEIETMLTMSSQRSSESLKDVQRRYQRLEEKLDRFRTEQEKGMQDAGSIQDSIDSLKRTAEDHARISEVQSALDSAREEISKVVGEFRSELDRFSSEITQVSLGLEKKASCSQLEEVIQRHMKLQHETGTLRIAVDEQTTAAVAPILQDLQLKANMTDVMNLLDAKADNEGVNQRFGEVSRDLENRATRKEWTSSLKDQAMVNEVLCAEHSLGRWIWKKGEVRPWQASSSALIPWDVQVVNTCPDNFDWQADQTHIVAQAPGLYEVSFGVFGKRRGTVSCLVNNEVVLVISNVSPSIGVRPHQGVACSGLSLIEFLVLPANAEVGLIWAEARDSSIGKGAAKPEGFLSLRKL